MKALLMAIVVLAGITHANAGDVWLEVTRPMVQCSGSIDTPEMAGQLTGALLRWKRGESPGDGCYVSDAGSKIQLDGEYTRADGTPYLKAWEFICRECVPWMSPIYLPTREQVGAYLRPTTTPEGYESDGKDAKAPAVDRVYKSDRGVDYRLSCGGQGYTLNTSGSAPALHLGKACDAKNGQIAGTWCWANGGFFVKLSSGRELSFRRQELYCGKPSPEYELNCRCE